MVVILVQTTVFVIFVTMEVEERDNVCVFRYDMCGLMD